MDHSIELASDTVTDSARTAHMTRAKFFDGDIDE